MNRLLDKQLIEIIRNAAHPLQVIPTALEPNLFSIGSQPVRAVLFDVYGTLFLSASGDIGAHVQEELLRRRIDELLYRYRLGKSAHQVSRRFFEEVKKEHHRLKAQGIDYPEVLYEDIWAKVLGMENEESIKCFATEYEMIVNPVYPMPYLKEVMDALKRKKLLMGIISNAQFFTPLLFPAFLDRTLEQLGFQPQLTIYSYICRRAKPSVYMFEKAGEILVSMGIAPGEVLYVGNDMLKDILPAAQTGFRTVLFAGDGRSLRLRENDRRCRNITPNAVVTNLKQIV